jgi:Flp pilus assembly protein TadD
MTATAADADSLKHCYEGILSHNPNNADAISFLGIWHLDRQSFQTARKYFAHLSTIRSDSADVWMCLCIACALNDDFRASVSALTEARKVTQTPTEEVRLRFCYGKS